MNSFRGSQNRNKHAPIPRQPGSTTDDKPMDPPAGPPALRFRSLSNCGHSRPSASRVVQRSASARMTRQHTTTRGEVMLSDVVGNGISGILHKWVNYGRGWRPRWFVLHDGVLSYYKIHGPDKLVLNHDVEDGSMVIGEESLRRINSHRHCPSRHRKPVSEIHLMVCSVQENSSDKRRFSVCTGTKKRLHLRAESKEDRTMWVEAMMAVKDMYPRLPNAEVLSPVASVAISTEKLRERLLEEGLSDATIGECEEIMKFEFSQLKKQMVALKHKHLLLVDTLRQLESEKVDLENTLIEDQRQSKDGADTHPLMLEKYSEGSGEDSSDEHDRMDPSDDDDDAFFDTCEILSTGSDHLRSCHDSEQDETGPNEICDEKSPIGSVGFNYPHIKRRKKLPDPVEKESSVSLWSIIKDNIGKDLTKVCLPVYFNEPLSSLQKCFEDVEYSYLLDQAYEWGKMGDGLKRMIHVAGFAASAYASTKGRSCKPFNPLLGETYEADYPDKGIHFISEKVSHHPMIVACHCEGRGWKFWGDVNLKSKFWGRSIQLDPIGVLTVEFDDGETIHWSKVTTSIYNLILGKLYCDHYGTMRLEGNSNYVCKIKFKEQSIIDRNPHQIHGIVEDKKGKTVATLIGKWDESLHYVIGGSFGKGKGSNESSKPHFLWKKNPPPEHQTRYNFTQFAITLNEITPGLKEKLPPTDSRLRPDQRCLENGQYEMANSEKLRLEQRQRQARKMQEKGWKPRWFAKEKGSISYRYIGGYWESREKGNWESCPDIFGQFSTDTDATPTP
ncbi:oxysterol-binding protein-related protein 1B-like isoform X1 [Vigna unguiculata]|uniref:Sterol binding ankyrin repeat protein n=1 Tax=Vigna unguiculata TaxID=3917 RepID=A0A4D6NQX6_VIGUN|nr:oxysterol-binding protein-related protein 1B-like isoform X1 [Vigna unguiculata]QCE15074.1 sterol binding ankyrin repeat protein [Vigna unguiculata]